MNDKVFVSNLCILGRHGVLEEEQVLGQRFFLDIEVTTDARRASANDDPKKAICYGALCDIAQSVSDAGPYLLIETLAELIIDAILERFATATAVRVRVRKPGAPISASFDTVGVELERPRQRNVGFSLGSNVGEKSSQIRAALVFLEAVPGIEVTHVSRFYKTAPWGKEDQDWFVNACAVGQTSLTPHEVLRALKEIEVQLGRTPGERWGPRLIDIDLLYLDGEELSTSALSLPHPEILNRNFGQWNHHECAVE
ncbi:MAG: 2-amino-4-hydroxy-6-hydroxymethyldihydropteridine diphosphokinase, partial [Pseudomonadota bacterium]